MVESSVVDLGVVIDQELKMDVHVGIMTRSCFYQLRQLRTIRQSLSDDATRMLIHSIVVTRVDYCNSVLSGITVVQTDHAQRTLNAAARLLLRIPKFAPVAALIRDHLHWLPATKRIRFKILLLVSKCIHQRAPSYLQELCVSGFISRGTSKFAVCGSVQPHCPSLPVVINAEAWILSCGTDGMEQSASSYRRSNSCEQ